MGNNHDQYFGKDKRKIIVLGLEGSGKTSKDNKGFSSGKLHCHWKSKHKNIKNKKSQHSG